MSAPCAASKLALIALWLALGACEPAQDAAEPSGPPSAQAPPEGFAIPDEIVPLLQDWGECLSGETRALLDDPRSSEEIVQAVYAACDDKAAIIDGKAAQMGLSDESLMATVKSDQFERAVRSVEAVRSGAPPPTPEGLWGACVGHEARALAGDAPAGEVADMALDRCSRFEDLARDAARTKLGEAFAEQAVEEHRASLRELAVEAATAIEAGGER